ncbi:MAG: nickel pincer cofactor biosynthesis protein LarC [Actinobacteria bacterium]|nr:nickel pincer cofactor biosynthesis protein LarC [Actinomycetota bacterium]
MAEGPPTVAWFHCFAGIAGDMALGALVDAGADLDEVRALVGRIPVTGWSIEAEATMRNGIAATRVVVAVEPTTVTRTYAHIDDLLDQARLPERVRDRAAATFAAIAAVEGRLHRRPVEQVHFHELGSVDAIVDIVGVASALEVLGVEQVYASPVATGLGMVRSAHGMLPNPAPAVVELLSGAPTHGVDVAVELTTPTGAGLLAALCEGWGAMPAMTIASSGFGAGTRELEELPNLTQVVIGRRVTADLAGHGQPVVKLEVNVDDVTGEVLAHAVASLLDAGAHDAWTTPIVMKKGRPAHLVSVLADPATAAELAAVLALETGSLGVRWMVQERRPAPRHFDEVDVGGVGVRVKVAADRVKVEHDDAAAAAAALGLRLSEVVTRAEEAWRRRRDQGPLSSVPDHDDTVVDLRPNGPLPPAPPHPPQPSPGGPPGEAG